MPGGTCPVLDGPANSVPGHLSGMASGTTNMVRDLGQTLGPALVGTVALGQAAVLLAGSLQGAGLPEAQLRVAEGVLHEGGPFALATAPLGPLSGTVGPLARAVVEAGPDALRTAGERALGGPSIALDEVTLRAPLEPPTLRDFITFEAHVEGIARRFGDDGPCPEWYAAPAFYFSNPYAVVGPFDPVPVPPGCRVFDFELELAAVIGRAGRDLTPEQAREHIVGYTILNDWSARDLQAREMAVHLGPAKGKDTASTLGPYLVTADELEPYRTVDGRLDLEMVAIVNGVAAGRGLGRRGAAGHSPPRTPAIGADQVREWATDARPEGVRDLPRHALAARAEDARRGAGPPRPRPPRSVERADHPHRAAAVPASLVPRTTAELCCRFNTLLGRTETTA